MSATNSERPTAAELITLVRENGPKALAGMKWLDETVDYPEAAEFLGMDLKALRTVATRRSAVTGRAGMPEPARTVGRSPLWTRRAIVLHRAAAPGRGAPGMAKPGSGRRKPADD